MSSELRSLAADFYRHALEVLVEADLRFLIGGAYGLEVYTGIPPHTKDLDIFVCQEDVGQTLQTLSAAGYRTQLVYSHWIAKVFWGDEFIDIIFNSGNGICPVDASWFDHAQPAEVLGLDVRLCPAEETIWQKAFIMERQRYDGADVIHLLRACSQTLDWQRLLNRFGDYGPVLLSHLILFDFVYPSERWRIPDWVLQQLFSRFQAARQQAAAEEAVCHGPLLSALQYLVDLDCWGYQDPRLRPPSRMTAEQVALWTASLKQQ